MLSFLWGLSTGILGDKNQFSGYLWGVKHDFKKEESAFSVHGYHLKLETGTAYMGAYVCQSFQLKYLRYVHFTYNKFYIN